MQYIPNKQYTKTFPDKDGFSRAVLPIVIKTIGQWCTYYQTGVLAPKERLASYGKLPNDPRDKEAMLEKLRVYILSCEDLSQFLLWMDARRIPRFFTQKRTYMCDRHDDLHSWVLQLDEEQYKDLQTAFTTHNVSPEAFIPR